MEAHRDRRAWLFVALATLLALALRLPGLTFGLPAMIEDDAGVLVRQIEMVRDGTPAEQRDENWTLYPHLLAEIAGRVCPDDAPRESDTTLGALLERASSTHVVARAIVLLFSLLAVPFTFLLARRFVAPGPALFASALVATSLLFECFATEARPHAAAAACVLMALVASLRLVERGDAGSFVLAGLAGGVAIGCLQSDVLVAAPIVIACGACVARGTTARGSLAVGAGRKAALVWSAVAIALATAIAWSLYPSSASDLASSGILRFDAATKSARFFGHNIALGEFDASGFATVAWSLWSFEPVATALAGLATLVWIVRVRRSSEPFDWFAHPRLFLVVAYAVLHLVAIGMYARTYERFALPLVPIAACMAAWVLERIADRFARRRAVRVLVFVLPWAAIALPAAVRFAILHTEPTAHELTARWLETNARKDERIALHPLLDVPLLRSPAALAADARSFTMPWRGYTPWRRFQGRLADDVLPADRFDLRPLEFTRIKEQPVFQADPAAWLRRSGAGLVVLPSQVTRDGPPIFELLRTTLAARAELVARFPARADGEHDVVLEFEDRIESDRPHWTWNLLTGDPIAIEVIEIWRPR